MTKEQEITLLELHERVNNMTIGQRKRLAELRAEQPTPPLPAGAGTETPTPRIDTKKIAGLAKYIHDEADVIWGIATNEADKQRARRYLDVVYVLHDYMVTRHELTSLRRQAEADRATIEELKGHHQRDEEMIVQRTQENAIYRKQWAEGQDIIHKCGSDIADLKQEAAKYQAIIKSRYEEILSLRAQLATADKDRERMDWLERDGHSIETDGMVQSVVRASDGETFLGDTLRDAISAALQPSPSLDHGATGETEHKP